MPSTIYCHFNIPQVGVYAICKYCYKSLKYKRGDLSLDSSSLVRHIKANHPHIKSSEPKTLKTFEEMFPSVPQNLPKPFDPDNIKVDECVVSGGEMCYDKDLEDGRSENIESDNETDSSDDELDVSADKVETEGSEYDEEEMDEVDEEGSYDEEMESDEDMCDKEDSDTDDAEDIDDEREEDVYLDSESEDDADEDLCSESYSEREEDDDDMDLDSESGDDSDEDSDSESDGTSSDEDETNTEDKELTQYLLVSRFKNPLMKKFALGSKIKQYSFLFNCNLNTIKAINKIMLHTLYSKSVKKSPYFQKYVQLLRMYKSFILKVVNEKSCKQKRKYMLCGLKKDFFAGLLTVMCLLLPKESDNFL